MRLNSGNAVRVEDRRRGRRVRADHRQDRLEIEHVVFHHLGEAAQMGEHADRVELSRAGEDDRFGDPTSLIRLGAVGTAVFVRSRSASTFAWAVRGAASCTRSAKDPVPPRVNGSGRGSPCASSQRTPWRQVDPTAAAEPRSVSKASSCQVPRTVSRAWSRSARASSERKLCGSPSPVASSRREKGAEAR